MAGYSQKRIHPLYHYRNKLVTYIQQEQQFQTTFHQTLSYLFLPVQCRRIKWCCIHTCVLDAVLDTSTIAKCCSGLQLQVWLADGDEVCGEAVQREPVEQGDVHLPEGQLPADVWWSDWGNQSAPQVSVQVSHCTGVFVVGWVILHDLKSGLVKWLSDSAWSKKWAC